MRGTRCSITDSRKQRHGSTPRSRTRRARAVATLSKKRRCDADRHELFNSGYIRYLSPSDSLILKTREIIEQTQQVMDVSRMKFDSDCRQRALTIQTTRRITTKVPISPYPNIVASVFHERSSISPRTEFYSKAWHEFCPERHNRLTLVSDKSILRKIGVFPQQIPLGRHGLPSISNNVGPVKSFLCALLRSLFSEH